MNLKEIRLDFEALMSEVAFGHGYLHYGYWKDGKPETPSFDALSKAKVDYFDKLVEMIPNDVSSILDVGSGTGSNAKGLIDKGYSVDCVCPSKNLNQIASQKLLDKATIFECKFEDFEAKDTYDMLIFSESFHYTYADIALKKASEYAEKYVLIFDYFRKNDSDDFQRISYNQFSNLLKESLKETYETMYDEDVTDYILPTFFVTDEISNNHIKPFLKQLITTSKKEHPIYSFILTKYFKKLLNGCNRESNRYTKFKNDREYRLIVLAKK